MIICATEKGLLFGNVKSNLDIVITEAFFENKDIKSVVEFEVDQFVFTSSGEREYVWVFNKA